MSIVRCLSVGDGDMFYIRHGSDSFTMIDCCMSAEDRESIVHELSYRSADKRVTRFISTHPDDDHIHGLRYLNEEMPIQNFYCVRNQATRSTRNDDFDDYCALRDADKAFYLSRGCSRKWLNQYDDERGSAGIHVLWPIVTNPHYESALATAKDGCSPNNISPIIKYSLNDGAAMLWMGDLETGFMESIVDAFTMDTADILFAPHHGRDSGKVPKSWLDDMDPEIVVIGEAPAEYLNYYAGYNTITQNSAGHIAFECVQGAVHIYVSKSSYSVDFLEEKGKADTHGKYIGTLSV